MEITHRCDDDCRTGGCSYEGSAEQDADQAKMDAAKTTIACGCGHATDEACGWRGPKDETVLVEYMPDQFRASHEAAGNRGQYPHNGAIRFRAQTDCADELVESEDGWANIIDGE